MPPLSILIWLPAACGLLDARRWPPLAGSRPLPGALALVGSLGALGLAIALHRRLPRERPALQHVTDVVWISELGIHYKLGVERAEPVPGRR